MTKSHKKHRLYVSSPPPENFLDAFNDLGFPSNSEFNSDNGMKEFNFDFLSLIYSDNNISYLKLMDRCPQDKLKQYIRNKASLILQRSQFFRFEEGKEKKYPYILCLLIADIFINKKKIIRFTEKEIFLFDKNPFPTSLSRREFPVDDGFHL